MSFHAWSNICIKWHIGAVPVEAISQWLHQWQSWQHGQWPPAISSPHETVSSDKLSCQTRGAFISVYLVEPSPDITQPPAKVCPMSVGVFGGWNCPNVWSGAKSVSTAPNRCDCVVPHDVPNRCDCDVPVPCARAVQSICAQIKSQFKHNWPLLCKMPNSTCVSYVYAPCCSRAAFQVTLCGCYLR